MVEVERKQALIENIDTWALDLATLTWKRRTKLDWQRWIMKRADDKYSTLWPLRMLSEYTADGNEVRAAEYRAQVEQSCGRAPDITLYPTRYLCPGARPLVMRDDPSDTSRIELDGVEVKFVEHGFHVAALVHGRLADDSLEVLQRHVVDRLNALENTDVWHIKA